ncbi:MAG: hypothetical protein DSY33_02855 [Archaeoglobus sp.]|nr:MAG: hypothetical protein DSY33_02855 [Archaeoglobus sp.]
MKWTIGELNLRKIVILIVLASIILGCSAYHVKSTEYAKLFSVRNHSGYVILRDTSGRKIVLFNSKKPDIKADLFIKVPVRRVVVLSTGIVSYIEALNSTDSIVGVPHCKWYYRNIEEYLKKGKIKDVGTVENPNYEEILALKPDVVFIPAKFISGSVVRKFKSLGIPYVSCGYWLEENPIGKLEWIKFFGYFLGKERLATEYFNSAEKRIMRIEEKVRGLNKTKVVYALILNGRILVPGGKSYHAKLVEMAGGSYVFSDINSAGYVTISKEELLAKASNADVFIAVYMGTPVSIKEITEQVPGIANTKPFRERRVYAMQPWIWQHSCEVDRILEDLTAILHPAVYSHKLVMFRRLN